MLNILHGVPNATSVKKLFDRLGNDLQLCWHEDHGVPYLCVVERESLGPHWAASIIFRYMEEVGQIKEVLSDPDIKPLTFQELTKLELDDSFWRALDAAIARLYV